MSANTERTMDRLRTIGSRGRMNDEDADILFNAADLILYLTTQLKSVEHSLECAMDDARDYETLYRQAEWELALRTQ